MSSSALRAQTPRPPSPPLQQHAGLVDEEEQREHAQELLMLVIGAGLLALGWAWERSCPTKPASAALSSLWRGWWPAHLSAGHRGLRLPRPWQLHRAAGGSRHPRAVVTGDFITAGMVPLLMEVGHLREERSIMGSALPSRGSRSCGPKRDAARGRRRADRGPRGSGGGRHGGRATGKIIPADAVVLRGTQRRPGVGHGRSLHEDVSPGSRVFAGTTNLDGLLRLDVRSVGSDTALGRVIALLQEAEDSKAPITRLLERYATAYLPLVLVVAAVVLFVTGDVERAIAVLVVACPCALVLSGPAAMVAALAVASRWGILIKGPSFLERVSEVDTVVLDKTGTVTLGTLSVLSLNPVDGVEEAELLEAAGCCGHGSLHPASRAAAEAARAAGVELLAPQELREEAGQGVEALTDSSVFRLGRASWLQTKGISVEATAPEVGIAVYASRDDRVLGWLELADTPRPEAAEASGAAGLGRQPPRPAHGGPRRGGRSGRWGTGL